MLNEQNGTDTSKCPDCNNTMTKTMDNDPLITHKTKYKCTECGNEHIVYK